ncbi:hypothetical protein SAMN05421831_10714 [Allopseudospirillum japonicum]|uniref:Uncharacterized protein n=1 Tax=Allopseudospirillum japonicum TaxID=64971 RepID=A0A1H6ST73_9GAMM|nr:hypothetical protein [Allopseudospirillum japonicum]SEI66782.1 hypothetical protein SAMN05421831_10714 [Allopseudospirillum japonicum]
MAHDENFRDEAGIIWVVLAAVVLVSMCLLPATIVWTKYFSGTMIPYLG